MDRETLEAYALATAGGLQGFARYYVAPELTVKRGWAAIGAAVLAFDLLADETLSSGSKALCEGRTLPKLAIGFVALHLMGAIPEQFDPLTQLHNLIRSGHETPLPVH